MTGPLVQSFLRKSSNASAIFLSKHDHVCQINKNTLAHVSVFGSKTPNEPVLARNTFVRRIPQSGSSGLNILAGLRCDQNDALSMASTCLCTPCTRRADRA